MRRPDPLCPARLRVLDRPFGWLPLRLLTAGHWARLSAPAQPLYAFLALVADRQGVSFYGEARLTTCLHRTPAELQAARAELGARDLLAFGRGTYQLLALPGAGPPRGAPPRPPTGVPEALRALLARWDREA
jgi:hypothetical protein